MPLIPSPTTSPRRRVLADKTTNASVSASNSPKRKHSDRVTGGHQRHREPPFDRQHAPVTAGHKRAISQVEDFEQQSPRGSGHNVHGGDPVLSSKEKGSIRRKEEVETVKIQREKLQPPGQSSFHASQEPEAEVETTFDIQDEVLGDSQIEKLNATHIPHDHPSQKKRDLLDQETSPSQQKQQSTQSSVRNNSQDSLHMSSFLDFSPNDADDKSLKLITPPSAKTRKSVDDNVDKVEARRKFMAEKAALLRTNLQLAYHKIQTNQTTTPFRKLKPPPPRIETSPTPSINNRYPTKLRDESPEPTLPAFFPPPFVPTLSLPTTASKILQPRESSTRTFNEALSPESRVSALRATANAQPKPPTTKPLVEIPEPKLRPTAYSARWSDRIQPPQPRPQQEPKDALQPTPPTSTAQTSRESQPHEKLKEAPQPSSPQLPSSPPPSNREASFSLLSDHPQSAERIGTPSPSLSSQAKQTDETKGKGKETTPVQLSSPPGSRENSPAQLQPRSPSPSTGIHLERRPRGGKNTLSRDRELGVKTQMQTKTPRSKDVGAAIVVPSSVVRGKEAADVLMSISGSNLEGGGGRGGGEEEKGEEEKGNEEMEE